MRVYYSEEHRRHAPKAFLLRGRMAPNREVPERAEIFAEALQSAGYVLNPPRAFDDAAIAAVHDAGYLEFMRDGHAQWRAQPDASEEILPNVHPSRHMSGRPDGIVGRAGYYMADTACPIGEGTWPAARTSADVALSAAEAVLGGAPSAYGLCRPPGHHAFADLAGGFCFLNNVAIAARYVRSRAERVAILDVDVHHGNGTQGIFYDRPDVLFVSLHGDPNGLYPFFAGYRGERGSGAGEGFNHNYPLAKESGDEPYLEALAEGLAVIRDYGPEVLLVSLGVDAQANDPSDYLRVTTTGFRRIGAAIGALGLPSILIQEGGYICEELGPNLVGFMTGFSDNHLA